MTKSKLKAKGSYWLLFWASGSSDTPLQILHVAVGSNVDCWLLRGQSNRFEWRQCDGVAASPSLGTKKKKEKLVITGGNVDVERRRDEILQPGAIPLSSSVRKRVACYSLIVFSAWSFCCSTTIKVGATCVNSSTPAVTIITTMASTLGVVVTST